MLHDNTARIFKLLRIPGIDSKESIPKAYVAWRARAGIFKQSMGGRNQVGIGLSYRLGIQSLESIPELLKRLKIRAQYDKPTPLRFLAPIECLKIPAQVIF
jgi:hypothetical protein